jgi:phosphoribosylaminoimidazolecarboxamide formyltransferase/IMP cyclohydrolase
MKQAFLSVSDKTHLEALAMFLVAQNIRLIASRGTAAYLQAQGIVVQSIDDYLSVKPILDGRVKTLHPQLFAGILADRAKPAHLNDLSTADHATIDYVIVDLYPFADFQDIEHIDIGGVALLRAAAKNYEYVTVVGERGDYVRLMDELTTQKGETRLAFRKALALKAFRQTMQYDAGIAAWLSNDTLFSLNLSPSMALSYGENPHQSAEFYTKLGDAPVIQPMQGKPLSYNNLLDLDAGVRLVQGFIQPAAVVIKHTNPCGVALGECANEVLARALQADKKSAFGGIVVLNQAVDLAAVESVMPYFIEMIAAPFFTVEALTRLQAKPNCRVIQFDGEQMPAKVYQSALNGVLVQTVDASPVDWEAITIPTQAKPSERELADLKFAFQVVRHVKSNAIVIAKQGVTIAIGAGQTNRVDAAAIALQKAKDVSLKGAVLASDGFFPFADTIELLAKTPIRCVIQPGGSIRDAEVIATCDRLGISMVMTHQRGFRH